MLMYAQPQLPLLEEVHTVVYVADREDASLRIVPPAPVDAVSLKTSQDYTVEIHRGSTSIIDPLADEWLHLCAEGLNNQPFFTPSWIKQWVSSFAPKSPLVIVTARRNGQLRGILPLLETRIGIGGLGLIRLKSPSNFYSGRADMVLGPGDAEASAKAIWNKVRAGLKWHIIEYRTVAAGSSFDKLVDVARDFGNPVASRESQRSPYLSFEPFSDASRLGPDRQLRRSKRNLGKLGDYVFRQTRDACPTGIQLLIDMEAASWKRQMGTDIGSDPAAVQFYTAVATTRDSGYTPVVSEIKLDNNPIAVDFGLEMGGRYFACKGSYDEEYRRHGPGHLNVHEMVVALAQDGYHEFDFLGTDEPYKLAWTDEVRPHFHHVIFPKGLRGRAMHLALSHAVPLLKRWKSSPRLARLKTLTSRRPTTQID
jgi:CelD/BcsL family acetyltransferase involved in cellulose biosynthesis